MASEHCFVKLHTVSTRKSHICGHAGKELDNLNKEEVSEQDNSELDVASGVHILKNDLVSVFAAFRQHCDIKSKGFQMKFVFAKRSGNPSVYRLVYNQDKLPVSVDVDNVHVETIVNVHGIIVDINLLGPIRYDDINLSGP